MGLLAGCSGKDTSATDTASGTQTPTTNPAEDSDGDGVVAADDCDDGDAAVYPGAPETCDGKDSDCDGSPHPLETDEDGDGVPDCSPCADAGYWELLVAETTGDALRAALTESNPDPSCDYAQAKRAIYQSLDLEDGNVVSGVYTGEQVAIVGGGPEDDALNIEHSWPRSEGADAYPADCDVHHLYPTLVEANTVRESHPYGEVTGSVSWSRGGSQVGSGSGGTVFEPRDVHKGNAARSMLYVWIQHGYAPTTTQRTLYGAWSSLDPVDTTDQDRDAAGARLQGNHNPFVACPLFVERMLDAG